MAASLPEDILFEIFSRVGNTNMKTLFRCAVTCKGWLSAFTDPDFLRRLWPDEQNRGRLLGFFLEGVDKKKKRRRRRRSHASSCFSALSFVPTPRSPIGYGDCVLRSFVPDDHDVYDSVEHLASHRGLTLLRFVMRPLSDERRALRFVHGVCDPITGAHAVFPPVDCHCFFRGMSACAILTAADVTPRDDDQQSLTTATRFSSFSQLLFVGREDYRSRDLHVHTYSSATRSWSTTVAGSVLPVAGTYLLGATAAVVHRGAANWLCYVEDDESGRARGVYVLRVEAGTTTTTTRVSLTKLPIRDLDLDRRPCMFLCTGRRDGSRLYVARVRMVRIDIWTTTTGQQRDDDGGGPASCRRWRRVQEIGMPSMAMLPPFRLCGWLSSNSGTVLATHRTRKNFHVSVLNIETAAVEEVMGMCGSRYYKRNEYYKLVPYKMDLPEFFLGQLASLKSLIT